MAINLTRQGGQLKYKNTTSGFVKELNLNSFEAKVDPDNSDFILWSDGSRYRFDLFDNQSFANSEEFLDQIGIWKSESQSGAVSFNDASSGNTTTATLSSGSTFTGVGELNNFNDVMVVLKSDQNGVLYCEFSPDGINWDTSLAFQYKTDRINPPSYF